MCVSAKPADFHGTSVLVNLTTHPQHGLIFVVGYENTAHNHHDGPNALLLHLPGKDVTKENFIDTAGCKRIFKDLAAAAFPQPVSRGIGKSPLRSFSARVEVFTHGIYTVVLAQDARDIPQALSQVPQGKRPVITQELCDFYAQHRPGWPIALCCFDNREARQADPLLIWYRPKNPKVLVAPGIDCHSGGVPNLHAKVHVDHQLFFAADDMPGGNPVNYTDIRDWRKVQGFLPHRIVGFKMSGQHPNGDFAIGREELMGGNLTLKDIHRPGATNPLALAF